MRRWLYPLFISVLLIPAGCSGAAKNSGQGDILDAEVLYQSMACAGETFLGPDALWMDDQETYADLIRQLAGQTIGNDPPAPPCVDFTHFGVLLIRMGQKNSGGYSVALKDPRVRIFGETAFVHVDWVEPPPGALLPQVATCPCLMIRLPKSEYVVIEVVDQNDTVRAGTRIRP